jgi:exodeoxyribonuclease V alpha subunit
MNGSLGKVVSTEDNLVVAWDEGEMQIGDTRDMDLAYAITVHKAQGSQFSCVVVPVLESRLLDRTLIYTAITRAQNQVVLVGDRSAFERAVLEQPNTNRRQTALWSYMNRTKNRHHLD